MLLQVADSVLPGLIASSPAAVAVIVTVIMFLKRQKEQGEEFSSALTSILASASANSKALEVQIEGLGRDMQRLADRNMQTTLDASYDRDERRQPHLPKRVE